MATGAAVCSQFGFAAESTVGTAVTVTKFLKHVSIGGTGLDPIRVDDLGLGGCALVPTADRTAEVARQASREITLNMGNRTFGLPLKMMLGSSAVAAQVGGTALWRQIHNNGDPTGSALTVQFGMPEATATGTNRPFTLNGAKVTTWELTQQMNQLLQLKLTVDAWNEATATALATASYAASYEPYGWKTLSQAQIGTSASLVSSAVTLAGAATIANCKGISIRGTQPLRTDGFFAGGAGIKSEQLLNGFQVFEGELDLEFASRTQIYDIFSAYTTVPLQFTWQSPTDVGTSNFAKIIVSLPFCKLTSPGGNPQVSDPGTLDGKTSFRAYGDPAGVLPACQIIYDSLDTTL